MSDLYKGQVSLAGVKEGLQGWPTGCKPVSLNNLYCIINVALEVYFYKVYVLVDGNRNLTFYKTQTFLIFLMHIYYPLWILYLDTLSSFHKSTPFTRHTLMMLMKKKSAYMFPWSHKMCQSINGHHDTLSS